MRFVVLAFIAMAAIFMAYQFFQPTCPGGALVRDEADCRSVRDFDVAFCRDAFARAPAIARVSGPSYPQRGDCDTQWAVCVDHAGGWGPRPSGWCLARAGTGMAKRIEPQYADRR
jgi:uncharacterized protein YgiB involved in biofilm formation